jgi:hypothetical protein
MEILAKGCYRYIIIAQDDSSIIDEEEIEKVSSLNGGSAR